MLLFQRGKKWEVGSKGQLFFFLMAKLTCSVALGYYGTKKILVLNNSNDVNGLILLLEVDIDGDIYVLVNFYNNIESYKLHTSELNNFLNKVADISRK